MSYLRILTKRKSKYFENKVEQLCEGTLKNSSDDKIKKKS